MSVMYACLGLGTRVSADVCCRLTPSRVAHGTGLRRLQGIRVPPSVVSGCNASLSGLDRGHARDVPDEARQFAGYAHDGNIGMLAACGESAEATEVRVRANI